MADLAFDRYAAPSATAYHRSVANLLSRRDPQLWAHFADAEMVRSTAEATRFELLKRTERLDRAQYGALYAEADEIAEAMGVVAPIALYRAAGGGAQARNAALYFEPDAAHVLFEGDILSALDEAELRFLLGHELSHHKLWTLEGGRYWTSCRMLRWAATQPESATAYVESARLERLYTELFADRYGLWAVGDLEPALSAHVKISVGGEDVSAAAYLAQSEDALSEAMKRAAAASRREGGDDSDRAPIEEGPLRAALLSAWAHEPSGAEARARAYLDAASPLDRLDLVGQEHVDDLSHWLLYEFLTPPWSERELIRAHASEISPRLAELLSGPRYEPEDIDGLRTAIAASAPSVQKYFAYLLLDFATVDPQLDDVMLAAALVFADDFGLLAQLKAIAAQELKTTKTKLAEIEKSASEILARAEIALGAYSDSSPIVAAGGSR